MKKLPSIILLLIVTFSLSNCDLTGSNTGQIQRGVPGLLQWGGSPAVDGTGLTMMTTTAEYGIPGTFEDYESFFQDGEYKAFVITDFRLTGETTIRGWGASYPEIEILRIRLQN